METKKTILITEDDKALRDALMDALGQKDYNLLEAKNGKECLEIAFSKHPDLILMDILMPEMNGVTALKNLREDDWGLNVPVVILTNLGAAGDEVMNDIIAQKPMNYLIKSDWKLADVVKKIEDILNRKDS